MTDVRAAIYRAHGDSELNGIPCHILKDWPVHSSTPALFVEGEYKGRTDTGWAKPDEIELVHARSEEDQAQYRWRQAKRKSMDAQVEELVAYKAWRAIADKP